MQGWILPRPDRTIGHNFQSACGPFLIPTCVTPCIGNTASHVYIFGYQSMLAAGSLATTIGAQAGGEVYLPARLLGYRRTWNAVRDFGDNPRKRYVHTADWRVAGRVAFANLSAAAGAAVNGVCHRVAVGQLAELDFREQGYRRMQVDASLVFYPGHAPEAGLACYTYIDPQPDPPCDAPRDAQSAPVSRAYYDMGRRGAAAIGRYTPGFAADYLASTEPPGELVDDLAFVFFGADGRHLWLLDETDSSLVLLLRFLQPQFAAGADGKPELARPITPALAWLDLRQRRPTTEVHPRIPGEMARLLTGEVDAKDDAEALATASFWLCRLAATQAATISPDILQSLATDPDPWVRRAARLRHGNAS
jgi:hypothetical protein